MKSVLDLSRVAVLSTSLSILALLAGCGQKGPLYMPESKAPAVKPVPVPQTPPAPPDTTAPINQ